MKHFHLLLLCQPIELDYKNYAPINFRHLPKYLLSFIALLHVVLELKMFHFVARKIRIRLKKLAKVMSRDNNKQVSHKRVSPIPRGITLNNQYTMPKLFSKFRGGPRDPPTTLYNISGLK